MQQFHNPQVKRTPQGFSLVEVIISIAIVGILLTGFLGVFGTAQRNINRALGTKEAGMLKDALETEMNILRPGEIHTSAFEKAFTMVKNSSSETDAVFVYQYKASPVDNTSQTDDGILPPYMSSTESPGIQGKDYLTQVAVRNRSIQSSMIKQEFDQKSVVGSVYAVRMTQLVKDNLGNLILGTAGQIKNDQSGGSVNFIDYDQPIIVFQAEFFKLPSKALNYINSNNWNFTNIGAPVAVTNIAIRR